MRRMDIVIVDKYNDNKSWRIWQNKDYHFYWYQMVNGRRFNITSRVRKEWLKQVFDWSEIFY